MDERRKAKSNYKQHPPAAGIYVVRNIVEQKVFIGSAMNVQGKLNGVEFSLQQNSHYQRALQTDWNRLGPGAFVFEILDILEPQAEGATVDPKDLKELEALWIEKLQPFGERGYHTRASD